MVSVLFSILLMSPSVMIPTTELFSRTAVTPSLFSEISTITFLTLESELTLGFLEESNMSLTLSNNFFPKAPPG